MEPETSQYAGNLILQENLRLTVVFQFEEQWQIGRVNESGDPEETADGLKIPAGGGLTPPRDVVIAPVHLQGLSSDEVSSIVRKRAEDMAILSMAMTIAGIQLREALDSIAPQPQMVPATQDASS